MNSRAGFTTRRRGWQKVRRRLFSLPVLLIVAAVVSLDVVAFIGLSWAAHAFGAPTNGRLAGFVEGALIATTILVMVATVAVLSGGVNWITGSAAERWTGEILDALGPEWRVIHNLVFKVGDPSDPWEVDVDHVAVGPYGVLVLESKYSSDEIDFDAERLSKQVRTAAAQTQRNAARVGSVLRNAGLGEMVIPVLIYWGWRVRVPTRAVRKIGSVRFVAGADARRWASKLTTSNYPQVALDSAWTTLSKHADGGRDPQDR